MRLNKGDKVLVIPINKKGEMLLEFRTQLQADNKWDILESFLTILTILSSEVRIPVIPENLEPILPQPVFNNINPLNYIL